MSYPIGQKIKARRLFITEGQSQEKISKITNIDERSLANWSTKEGWLEKRTKYFKVIEEMELNKVVLKNVMIKKAIETQATEDIQRIILFEILTSSKTEPKRQLLDYLRKIKNLTYQEIGNICGVSRQAIHSNYNKPQKSPRMPAATVKIKCELKMRNEKIYDFAKRIKCSYQAVTNTIRGRSAKEFVRRSIAKGLDMKYSDIWPDKKNHKMFLVEMEKTKNEGV